MLSLPVTPMLQTVFPALCFAAIMTTNAQSQPQFPQATISNGRITAQFYLPDAEHGYYRGTRFDWSGSILSLKTAHHEYFGQWFPKYDPKLHDSIVGPVEEFIKNDTAVGYDEAKDFNWLFAPNLEWITQALAVSGKGCNERSH